ncbi:translocation and assembly module TamA [Mesorhizobium soli]|uniref:autotransporter assembly complex protein TamA n=1 Tax=Pseudaminobacter soli (ex Li et al. 2025) TaxID=1295366 RepID=UPI00247B4494|nr:translocation and assembly module TamA [Mesorhizobium soli]
MKVISASTRGLCLLVGLSLGAAPVAPAAAFDLFGMHLWGAKKTDSSEDIIGEPQNYTVDFSVSGGNEDVEKKLQGVSTLWADREKPASGAAGLLAKARGDYRRLLAALYSEGRYGGSISILVGGREAADLPPDTELPDPVAVRVVVNPGPIFLFGETSIINRAPPLIERNDKIRLPEDQGFRPGEVARSGAILSAERLSVEAWRQQGYAKAKVAERNVVAEHDRDIVDATLTMDPGRKAYFGPVGVEGTERIDPKFLAWMTGIEPGKEYDPDDLARASKRLARLEVFRAMRFQEADEIGKDGSLPVSLIVQERLPRRFGVGGSYSTLDGAGLEAYWLHRNLFGHAERLRLEGKVSGLVNTFKPDELTYRLGATFVRPGVYTPDTDFIASVIGEREVLDAYTRNGGTVQAGFNRIFSDELSGRILLESSAARFKDDVFGTRNFIDVGLLGGIVYDSRDNKTDATEGYYAEATLEPYYEFNYGNPTVRATAEGRAYYGFGAEKRVVAAGRIKVGSIAGPSASEIAPDKLFFAGGGGSVRGYAYRNIGVPVGDGRIIGGRSLIEGSAELRVRATDSIGVVGFVDAGYVGGDSIPNFNDHLRVGVGGGLRYITGLGPIRLDAAVPLNRGPGDPTFGFYVGIGQAF